MQGATLDLILEKVVQLDGKIESVKTELKAEFRAELRAELTRFATKDDLKAFATKDDLNNKLTQFATKDDLKDELTRFVTKDDIRNLKGDFKSLEDKVDLLAIHILGIDEKVDRCATKDELHAVKDDLLISMDRFAKRYETVDQEIAALIGRDDRLEGRVEILEKNRA